MSQLDHAFSISATIGSDEAFEDISLEDLITAMLVRLSTVLKDRDYEAFECFDTIGEGD